VEAVIVAVVLHTQVDPEAPEVPEAGHLVEAHVPEDHHPEEDKYRVLVTTNEALQQLV
jgi:hypothetical protein